MSKANIYDISPIDNMDGHEFEYFCAELLKKVGYTDVKVTPGSGDQGVDVLATKDGVKYAIQCKNYISSVSNTPVQEVAAGKMFYGCHVGVVITNSQFTPGAAELAEATNVLLWDRNKLKELISLAGGLESFGICRECENVIKTYGNTERSYIGSRTPTALQYIENSTSVRKGMYILANLFYVFSGSCFIPFATIVIFGITSQFAMPLLGCGLFTLIIGRMFGVLAKSPKGNTYVMVSGKRIKKSLFVFLCVVAAYVCFLVAVAIGGGIDTN